MNIRLFFSISCLCCFLPLWAQQNKVDTTKIHQLQEVRVVSKYRPSTTLATVPLQFISKENITRLGIQDLGDAVRRFSGITVKDYGGIGGLKTVSVRSLGATHTAVMYDGISVGNMQNGQVDIGRFTLDNVELISLSIGQPNSIFQSAQSLASAGVLNIETAQPDFSAKDYNLRLRLKGGSFGLLNGAVMLDKKLGDKHAMSIFTDALYAKGDYPYDVFDGVTTTSFKRENSAIRSLRGEFNLFNNFSETNVLKTKVYFYKAYRQLPGSVVLYSQEAAEQLWDTNIFAQTHLVSKFSEKLKLSLRAKYNYSFNKYTDDDFKYPSGHLENRYTQQAYYASALFGWQVAQNWALSFANDITYGTLETNSSFSVSPSRIYNLTSLAAQYQTESLVATATLLNTFVYDDVVKGYSLETQHRLSPSISFSYQPFSQYNWHIRTTFQDIFRLPTFNDLYYQQIGNSNLRPEKAKQINFGTTWSGQPFGAQSFVKWTLDYYHNQVDDKIVAIPNLYIWRMMNMGKVSIDGIDFSGELTYTLSKTQRLELSGNYSYQKAIDMTDSEAGNYKHQIPYTPKHSGSVAFSWTNPWVNIAYRMITSDERYMLPENIHSNRIDAYAEHSLSFSHLFKLKDISIRLQGDAINITDERYDVIKFYPMPGRSFAATIQFIL